MCEGLVCVGHAVDVVALFDGGTDAVVGIHDFGGEFLTVGVVFRIAAFARKLDEPADRERELAARRDWHRNLVSSATDAATTYFGFGLDVGERSHQNVEGFLTSFVRDNIHGFVDLLGGYDFFAVDHGTVDELGDFE